jgi:serine/threonine protein kinase
VGEQFVPLWVEEKMDISRNVFHEEDWSEEAEDMYERIEVLGRGSFGLVWMGKRKTAPLDEFYDEYVALKNIEIKEEKGKVYAQREISILSELRHPNVILLIRAFPIYKDTARLVALQLARGPNLQRVVSKRGAVGLPLARLVCRQLIAAVSYLHGRAVLHRDIKRTNCILENTELPPNEYYDYAVLKQKLAEEQIRNGTQRTCIPIITGPT